MAYRRIGIIGGLSPESTVSYYLHITRAHAERFGDYACPEVLIYSVSLQRYHDWRAAGRWDRIAAELTRVAHALRAAGAEVGLIATNTMHKVFAEVQAGTALPLIHILTPTVEAVRRTGITTVGVLGTKFTMAESFYQDELVACGLVPLVPTPEQQDAVHRIIVQELVRGVLRDESRRAYLDVIAALVGRGAEGVILGCTEIPLLVRQADCPVPVFDTAVLHADAVTHRRV